MRSVASSPTKKLRLLALLAIAILTTASCGGNKNEASYSHTISQMVPFIEQQMKDADVTGMAIVLVDDQQVVWAQGFGFADVAHNVPATQETLFEIGSNSKTMTASLVMQLAEAGLLHIDDSLTKYIPDFSIGKPLGDFPTQAGDITVRSMMTHHSGIPGDLFNGIFTTNVQYPDFNARLKKYLAGEYADYPPDFVLAYSNTATSLLADVVAAASGKTFRERSQEFFTTLGMDHTTFYRESATVPANQSKGYIQGQEYGPFYCNIEPAGSVLSSASDMAKYLKMVMAGGMGERGRVLKSETLDAMLTRTNGATELDYDVSIGLGWFLSDSNLSYAGRLCWHNGSTFLMMSHAEILLDHKLAAMVMTNSATGGAVAEAAVHKVLQLALEEKTGIRPPTPVPDPSPVVSWTDAQLDAVAGVYVTDNGYDLLTRVHGGLQWTRNAGRVPEAGAPTKSLPGLFPALWNPQTPPAVDAASDMVLQLVPRANGWFSSPDSQEEQYEFGEAQGRRVMITHLVNFSGLTGERYVPPATIPAAWIARLGKYDLVNLDENDASRRLPDAYHFSSYSMELKTKDGLLILEFTDGVRNGQQLVIHPLSDVLGYLRGLGRNLGGSVQVLDPGAGERIQILGYQYAKR